MELLSALLSHIIDLVKWVMRRCRKPDPVKSLEKRNKLRSLFEENLPAIDQYGTYGECVIRDIKRFDSYPDPDRVGKGISAWFTAPMKSLYHKGIEVIIGMPQYIKQGEEGKWQFTNSEDPEAKSLAYPVGRIPFDLIRHVDWVGDEYYNCPHVFCDFVLFRGQPYESIPFYTRYRGIDSELYMEVEDFRPWDKKKGRWLTKLKKPFSF